MNSLIRSAMRDDLARVNEIYNAYIPDRHTSFDVEPWTMAERADWYRTYEKPSHYDLLVLEVDGVVMGFAASSPFKDKAAYYTSVETTIVLDEGVVGRGLGRPLLEALLGLLRGGRTHRAYAYIALPNDPSIELHTALGYRTVGVLDEVGHKLGSFHSVQIMELALRGSERQPST